MLSKERYHGYQQKMVAIGFTIVKQLTVGKHSEALLGFTPAVLLLLGDV